MAKRTYEEEIIYVIGHNESGGRYDSINPTDVISIGLFNWYGARALGVARNIQRLAPTETESALSTATNPLYDQIISGNNNVWNSYRPGNYPADMTALRNMLNLSASKTVQDQIALQDSQGYISQAKARGIADPAAQIYFCDLYNQSPKQAGNIAASTSSLSLTGLHNAAMNNPVMNKYVTRRNWTYNELLTWNNEEPPEEPPVTPPVNPPNENGGGNLPPAAYDLTDYIIEYPDILIRFSDDSPEGRIYYKRNNIYYTPKRKEG